MRTLIDFIVKYSNPILFILLQAVSLYLLSTSDNYHSARIVTGVRGSVSFLQKRVSDVSSYLRLREANHLLAEENRRLKELVHPLATSSGSLFDADMAFTTKTDSFAYSVHKVVNNSVNKQRNFFTLSGGTRQGIEPDMAVAGPDGVAGIVVTASRNFSVAMSLLNSDFRLSVRLKSSGYFGSLIWDGESPNSALLREIPYHVEINRGDTIETSGYGTIFPQGIEVGVVGDIDKSRGDFYLIEIIISTDFHKLNYVYVIKNALREEQLSLEGEVGNE